MPTKLAELKLLDTENPWAQRAAVLSGFLREKFKDRQGPVKILEAGCGRSWPLDLGTLEVHLTGIDMDGDALDARMKEVGDIHRAMVGDLRQVEFVREEFDLIYSCEVLEHVKGAEDVLQRLLQWLKPDGAVVIIFPDRDTVFGFATRCSPHWLHVAYHKHIMGNANAGKPGFSPYRTYYDRVISRRGLNAFCAKHGCVIALEYGRAPGPADWPRWFLFLYRTFAPVVAAISFGKLGWKHIGLVYVVQKRGA